MVQLNIQEEDLVLTKEVANRVFRARLVVRPFKEKIPIHLMNTIDNEVRFNYFTQNEQKSTGYDVCKCGKLVDKYLNYSNFNGI